MHRNCRVAKRNEPQHMKHGRRRDQKDCCIGAARQGARVERSGSSVRVRRQP